MTTSSDAIDTATLKRQIEYYERIRRGKLKYNMRWNWYTRPWIIAMANLHKQIREVCDSPYAQDAFKIATEWFIEEEVTA